MTFGHELFVILNQSLNWYIIHKAMKWGLFLNFTTNNILNTFVADLQAICKQAFDVQYQSRSEKAYYIYAPSSLQCFLEYIQGYQQCSQ